ncbi:MAG: (Fe-S)-binding protein [Desulfobacteraceae bacterium]
MNKAENGRYSMQQCMQMAACTNCQSCADVCPAVKAAGDGRLSALYRMKGLQRILKSRNGGLLSRLFGVKPLSDEQWKAYSETVYRCTLCGNCQEVCPVGIHLKDLWISLREDLVDTRHFPKKINLIRRNLESSRNVFNEDNEERAEWVEDMDDPPEDLFVKDKAEVVYFTGCTAAYFPVAQKIPLALADILVRAEVDFTLMGEDEWCCGFPLLGAGLKDLFVEFAAHNLDVVLDKGAKQVIFACPSCYEMWKAHYPYKAQGIQILHSTQYLEKLALEGRLPFNALEMTVTYHDPCDLGRGAREFDAPRAVIGSIPGVQLVEMPNSRENCNCCGGGGNLEMVDAKLSAEIAKNKVSEAVSTGADAVITSCQQCVRTMLTYAKRNKVPIDVMDITQLVQRALA